MALQEAFVRMIRLLEKERGHRELQLKSTPPRGRTAVACAREEVPSILAAHGATAVPMEPLGVEISGVDATKRLHPRLAGALESLMADHGLVLLRGQGRLQREMGIEGKYLTGDEQCELSLAFGAGALHSTHGNHAECPNRDIFRLSNDKGHGFNEVGPEWHNDGSFEPEVFSHVVFHIVRAPEGPGGTAFAHLGKAFDALPAERRARYRRCASVNSNSGVVHPLVFTHPISGREQLYLHTGMTGSIIERVEQPGPGGGALDGIGAWNSSQMNELFTDFTDFLDRGDISRTHDWREGDLIVIDNLAVAHKATPGAHKASSGLRILHRTTCKAVGPLLPDPALQLPARLDPSAPCPFRDPGAVWVEGYVGFRWGDWQHRSIPH